MENIAGSTGEKTFSLCNYFREVRRKQTLLYFSNYPRGRKIMARRQRTRQRCPLAKHECVGTHRVS